MLPEGRRIAKSIDYSVSCHMFFQCFSLTVVYAMLELITLLLRTFYFFLLATNDGSNWQLIQFAVDYMRYVVSIETFSSPIFLILTR